jgi:hypothetical protein
MPSEYVSTTFVPRRFDQRWTLAMFLDRMDGLTEHFYPGSVPFLQKDRSNTYRMRVGTFPPQDAMLTILLAGLIDLLYPEFTDCPRCYTIYLKRLLITPCHAYIIMNERDILSHSTYI